MLTTKSWSRLLRFSAALMSVWCFAFSLAAAESADHPEPGTFRNFVGACQGGASIPFLYDLVAWDRQDISWSKLEPEKGKWNEAELEDWGRKILEMRAKGVRLLPILCYNASWSWDRAEHTYDLGDQRVHVKPLDNGKFLVETLRRTNGIWGVQETREERPNDHWPLAEKNESDWEDYVRRTVAFLRKTPYNIEYFQIWNEAYPTSDFWGHGDLDTYMKRIHIPAAKIIRELGGKVVYGGWPCCGGIQEYVSVLDRNRAWNTVDVLDVHYFPLSAFEYLNQAVNERGYHSLGIWQTELGFTTDPEFVGNTYPRFFAWCLAHNWNDADRYKLFFFCAFTPDDPKAYGYERALVQGSELSPHGLSLKVLDGVFSGGKASLYNDATTEPILRSEINENESSLESFQIGNKKLVLAIHLVENNDAKIFTDWNGHLNTMHLDFENNPTIKIDLPKLKPGEIELAERVDMAGQRQPMPVETAESGSAQIEVPVRDEKDSPANQWFNKSKVRSFLVTVTLK